MRPIFDIDQAYVDFMAELARDKQDDDWSSYAWFKIDFIPGMLGPPYYLVMANGHKRVGSYDSYEAASIVRAKLEYRSKEPIRGMIGLDGVPA